MHLPLARNTTTQENPAEDPTVRAAGVEYLKRCVDAVHGMGADLLSGVIYVEHGKCPSQRPDGAVWERSAKALRVVGEYAGPASPSAWSR